VAQEKEGLGKEQDNRAGEVFETFGEAV